MKRRIYELLAMLMIGDGLVAALEPRRHARLWLGGPSAWRRVMWSFVERPRLTRCVGVAQLGFGLWLARQQKLR